MSRETRYVNELQSFRNSVGNRIQVHKDKIGAVNSAIGIKTQSIIAQSKKLADTGKTLLESGVGVVGAVKPLSGLARRGITSVGNMVEQRAKANGMGNLVDNIKSKVGDIKSKVDDIKSRVPGMSEEKSEGKGDDGDPVPEPEEPSMARVTNAQEGGIKTVPEVPEQPTQAIEAGSRTEPTNWMTSGRKYDVNPSDETIPDGGEEKSEVADPTVDAGDDVGSDITQLRLSAKSGVDLNTVTNDVTDLDQVASNATEVGGSLGDAVGATEGGLGALDATAAGFGEAAAATSWLAWLGVPEILGAIGAVAGVVSAGVGIADAVKGGDAATLAQQQGDAALQKVGVTQVAGSYAVPTQDSLN